MEIRKDKKALDKVYRRRDRYDLQPDFQRDPVWTTDRQQKLMDTILREWDIPKIYLRVIDDENFECIDGQQRLTAIFKFYDNELPLPEKISGEYGGLYYGDLPDKIKDIFDDYELDIALVYDATDEELRDLFARLQLGMVLNSAEKLNAMSGNMRDFVRGLSEHKFFEEKTPIHNKRFSFQAIMAQICLLELEGIKNAKFKDLEEFYKKNKSFDGNSTNAKKIKKIIDLLDEIFGERTSAFGNRASVISFYLLISSLIKNNFDVVKYKEKLKDFYIDFQRKLKTEIEKGAEAMDTELIVYQSKVNQAADSKDAILKRDEILKRKLVEYDESFKEIFITDEVQEELYNFQKARSIKKITDKISDLIIEINKIYSAKKQEDLFKPTSDLISGLKTIEIPVTSKDIFKNFIDSSYKIFYEGSGSLKRIPENLKNNNSVFFDIKHIRTDFFHDCEHGEKKQIYKKKKTICEIYMKYLQKKAFASIQEDKLIYFQKMILSKLEEELVKVKKEISE